jgi:hypothetical protein
MSIHRHIAIAFGAIVALSSTAAQAGNPCQPGQSCYKLVTTPAEYGTVAEQVMVSPERRVSRHIPAEYGVVQEQVMVHPARRIAHHVPAVVNTVAEQVMISPASKVWQVTRDAHGQTVGCWVVVPARYGVQHRQVVVQPASVQYSEVPAQYATRSRKVMTRAADVHHETIPAQYQTHHRQVMTRQATRGWQPVGYGY